MSVVYFETSALLSWLFGESRAGEVRRAIGAADQVVTSAVTFVESERALLRAQRSGQLREGDARRLRGFLARAREGWMTMDMHARILERASQHFPVEPVRTLDALHLATALFFTEGHPDLQMLTFDERITSNAEALGISRG